MAQNFARNAGIAGVQSVTGLDTNNTDPSNPVVQISVDNVTVTGLGTPGSPLVAVIPPATGITSINSQTGTSQTIVVGTSGANFNVSSVGNIHTLNLPVASGSSTGKLSSADWTTFNNKVSSTRAINTTNSITGGGDLSADRTLQLVNDALAPGNDFYYGTDGAGTKGFFPLPTFTPLALEVDGVPNGDQILLNLVAGTNMTLTDDGFGNVTFDATGGSGSGDAVKFNVNQTAHGFSVGNVIRPLAASPNEYTLAQADTAANAEAVGIVTAVAGVDDFEITTHGVITITLPTAPEGDALFLSQTVAGALTATAPTSGISKPMVTVTEDSVSGILINYRAIDAAGGGGSSISSIGGWWFPGSRVTQVEHQAPMNLSNGMGANTIFWYPINSLQSVNISAIGFQYVSGGGNYILGLWDVNPVDGKPLNLLEQSAPTTIGAAGVKMFNFSSLKPLPVSERRFVSFLFSATNNVYKYTSGMPVIKTGTNLNEHLLEYRAAFTYGVMPSDTSSLTITENYVVTMAPIIAMDIDSFI